MQAEKSERNTDLDWILARHVQEPLHAPRHV